MSASMTDRNLLIGVLALQMDFVSQDQLVEAMKRWVDDKQRPLGELLIDVSALTPEIRELLESVVEKHLEVHDGDAQRSLQAVHAIAPNLQDSLAGVGDDELQRSLDILSLSVPLEDLTETYISSPTSGRYQILRPHARGGLGEVFVARDQELAREVALKQIHSQQADQAERRERFLLEAEITGRLEHPGVVPVYSIGKDDDGRPFYAMRFIRGESLREAIQRFHEASNRPASDDASTQSSTADSHSVAFRRLLGRFVDVCQTLEYAHSRGIIHRDLKPDNIMLGPYGETLVVDWGLAKAVGRSASEKTRRLDQEPTLLPESGSGSAETQDGQALGTPAYMPPEQAVGRLDMIGPAADVSSLGATLYHLLTGRAPFRGDAVDVLRRVEAGKFVAPTEINSRIPQALSVIVLKAMATELTDRYASPGKLAGDIEAWLADEPVGAFQEPLTVRVGRWARRHRTLVSSLAVAVLAATVSLVAILSVVEKSRRDLKASNDQLDDANSQLVDANEELKSANAALAIAN